MGYFKEKKQKHQNKFTLAVKLKNRWAKKRPVFFFVSGFCLLLLLFYMFWQSDLFTEKIQPAVVTSYAFLSSGLLNLLSQHTQVNNDIIYSPSYSISLHRGCDAIEAIALFLSTTLAFPMGWKLKIRGLITGTCIIFLINNIRIVTLFLVGIYAPGFFEMMHAQIWPVIILIVATSIWIYFIRLDRKIKDHARN